VTAGSRSSARPGLVALRFEAGRLYVLDQTLLPWQERELVLDGAADVAAAIRRLAVRGAPLIGVAAAYGIAIELQREPYDRAALERACSVLASARPTAVNLGHAVARVRAAALGAGPGGEASAALAQARAIHADEEAASDALAVHGAELLRGVRRVLTHCNTGALAAPGRGTALAVISELAERGSLDEVLVCEARPLLQGARLTVYELQRMGIAHELLVDAAAPGVIASGAVDAVLVGCDRVAGNGDVANKVGTYPLALAAHAADIPFVVAGPTSSIDPRCEEGSSIEIEQRDAEEVRTVGHELLTIAGTRCRNPAFDLTPAALVTAFVTERGVARQPDADAIASLLAG
jgi:methylthioribose-1-phosphate isomerase